jgi:PhzF family phenazine biosynthesis protein
MIKLYQVDAFTKTPFKGNPAGVCLLETSKSDQWMIHLAREMNLSETAFLLKQGAEYNLRWFTPRVEVQLCGHATLASAHILWAENLVAVQEPITFEIRSGKLFARKERDLITLDFPTRLIEATAPHARLNHALNVEPLFTGKHHTTGGDIYLLEVASDDLITSLTPDYQALLATAVRSVIVTSRASNPHYDFVSRYFAPAVGVNEDPVTGSAHCCLAPYWGTKLGKIEMVGYQASARSGVVTCRWNHDRVILGGNAVTIFKIKLVNDSWNSI